MYTDMLQHTDKPQSDSILVERAFQGDQSAFEDLVKRYELELYNFVKRCLDDNEQARDAVQFVFLQLYRSLPRLQGNLFSVRSKRPLRSWLFRVALNYCRRELRKKQVCCFSDLEMVIDEETTTVRHDLADPEPLPEELAERHELRNDLYAAIRLLSARSRSVVLLRCIEDLSFGEISLRLNMPENTAKSHFHRARQNLRTLLEPKEIIVSSL